MPQPILIVVDRFDLTLYETLRARYAGVQGLTVIRDRRRGDRRRQPEKDEELRAAGSFSTPVLEEPSRSPALLSPEPGVRIPPGAPRLPEGVRFSVAPPRP